MIRQYKGGRQEVGPACRAGPRTTGGLPDGEPPVRSKVAGRSRSASGTYSSEIVAPREQNAHWSDIAADGRQPNGTSRRNQAACQMESRSWGNLTRRAGGRRQPVTRQIIGRTGYTVLHSAEQRLTGEMKGTPPERSHVPTAVHGFASLISSHAAAARCRGNLPVGSLPFDAPASTFHSDASALLLVPPGIVAPRKQKPLPLGLLVIRPGGRRNSCRSALHSAGGGCRGRALRSSGCRRRPGLRDRGGARSRGRRR